MLLNLLLILSTMVKQPQTAHDISGDSLLAGYKTEVIIYATGLLDRRNIPSNKFLIKSNYDLCIKIRDEKYLNEFSQIADKFKKEECKKCNGSYDTRILIEIYKKGKLQSEIEIDAPGATMRLQKKTYYLDEKFYDLLMDFLPKRDQGNYLPMGKLKQP